MYEYLIFDADHTLIDFNADEKAAFRRTFSHFKASYTAEDIHRAWVLSYTVWAEHGLNDIHLEEIQQTFHQKYVRHLPELFERIKQCFTINATAEELAQFFIKQLYAPSEILGNSLDVVKRLSEKYKVCVATNGLEEMQRSRLQAFLPYVYEVFVSERMGTIKPNKKFFTCMLSRLKTTAEKCLFIGDSLSSDIAGAATVNMDCVWLNPEKKTLPVSYKIKGQILKIEEIEKFL